MSADYDPMQDVIRHATFAADVVASEPHATGAARTRAIVARALEMCLGNGLIEVTDPGTWPEWIVMDPPYGKLGS